MWEAGQAEDLATGGQAVFGVCLFVWDMFNGNATKRLQVPALFGWLEISTIKFRAGFSAGFDIVKAAAQMVMAPLHDLFENGFE